MERAAIRILVDNSAPAPLAAEHGLSIGISYKNREILFDTGAGGALFPNLSALGISVKSFTDIVLSHGHDDHTGSLARVLEVADDAELFYASGITGSHYSIHPGREPHKITMPEDGIAALERYRFKREIVNFTDSGKGFYLTGAIPRESGEDCGGDFFHSPERVERDIISDEQALLLDNGVLIQGCCHSGIINTLEYCRKCVPEVPVRVIIGGLHLLRASEARLRQTVDHLNSCALEKVIVMHCTGAEASEFLKDNLKCGFYCAESGDEFYI